MSETTDYEAEYDNRARVPGHERIVEAWASEAAEYRRRPRAELDLPYGEDERNRLDLFWPARDRGGPIALYIHGGYWQRFDRSWFSHFARGLNTHGVPVAVASYRLCPHVRLANIIDDIRTCCRWLNKRHRRPILAVGHSAGGHLAAAALASDWALSDDRHAHRIVPAAVAISGIYDLEPLLSTSINAGIGMDAHEARELSPVDWHAPAGTWFTAVVGGEESGEFQRQASMIVDAWREGGVHTDLMTIAGANHFTVVEGLANPDSRLGEQVVALAHSLE